MTSQRHFEEHMEMSDETKPRHKTRDLRAMQAEATAAERAAAELREVADKAAARSSDAKAKARKAAAIAKRKAQALERAAKRDAFERAGKALMMYVTQLPPEKRERSLPAWRNHCIQCGMTGEMCDLIGLKIDLEAPVEEFKPPVQTEEQRTNDAQQ